MPLFSFPSFPLPLTNSNTADAIFSLKLFAYFRNYLQFVSLESICFLFDILLKKTLFRKQLLTSSTEKAKLQDRKQLTPKYLTVSRAVTQDVNN